MELLQLVYFCKAAKTENFSQTAKHFMIPPSAISQAIRRLEQELSVPLFLRTGNRVHLSAEGERFYRAASHALSTLESARKELLDSSGTVRGEIRLFIGNNRSAVVPVIEKYLSSHPGVSFTLTHSIPTDLSECDLFISHDTRRFAGMKKQFLLREKLLMAMPKTHPLAEKTPLALADFRNARFVGMNPETSLRTFTEQACHAAGFVPNVVVQSDDPMYVRKYVELGMGVALFPAHSWKGLFSGNTAVRDVGEIYRDTYLFSHPHGTAPLCVALFSDMLCAALADADGQAAPKP